MSTELQKINNLKSLLEYCSSKLNWPIDEEQFFDIDDLFYDFNAEDFGIKEEEFLSISNIKQLRPLMDNQPWGIFAVEFSGERLEISALSVELLED